MTGIEKFKEHFAKHHIKTNNFFRHIEICRCAEPNKLMSCSIFDLSKLITYSDSQFNINSLYKNSLCINEIAKHFTESIFLDGILYANVNYKTKRFYGVFKNVYWNNVKILLSDDKVNENTLISGYYIHNKEDKFYIENWNN